MTEEHGSGVGRDIPTVTGRKWLGMKTGRWHLMDINTIRAQRNITAAGRQWHLKILPRPVSCWLFVLKGERQEMRQTASGSKGGRGTQGFHSKSLTAYPCSRKIQGSLDPAQSKTDYLQWNKVLYAFALFLYFPITSHLPRTPCSLGEIADQAPLQALQVWRYLPQACRPLMFELVYIFYRNLGCQVF